MGAALHLAHAHQPPPGPKRKRKGGGGNDGPEAFASFARRIYADDRADGDARALLLAVAYAITLSGAGQGDGRSQWTAVRQALGIGIGRRRCVDPLAELVRKDVPRYTSPEYMPGGYDSLHRRCQAPRLRPYQTRIPAGADARTRAAYAKQDAEDFRNAQGVCGEGGQHGVVEKDPVTGWHTIRYFCNRHHAHAARVAAQVKAQNAAAPAPIPNQGGLLPSYFDADWLRVYRWHSRRKDWQPPVYGLRADDWPTPGRDTPIHHPRLRLVVGGTELDGETGQDGGHG
jgi:hypothetical protein